MSDKEFLDGFPGDSDAMSNGEIPTLLHRYAKDACAQGDGAVVEIGAYRGASTVALAKGVRDAGRGRVTSIDSHHPAEGIYGGSFSQEDHRIDMVNLERFGVAHWVDHLCQDSRLAIQDWVTPIDLLLVDGDHSYEGVSSDIALWTPFVKNNGVLIFDDVEPGSEVEEAIRDSLPFSRYRLVEQVGKLVVFRKDERPRMLYLCGGLQSSGSTLVSWSFLQRQDLDGVLDMDNSVIHQDFSRVKTDPVWLKMTIGAFRLTELVDLFSSQGWTVKPILMRRNLNQIYRSLRGKPYGIDGATGDEPPLHTRVQRYLADLETANESGWPILEYEDLIAEPQAELQRVCNVLGLDWDDAMMSWPKKEDAIAYAMNGNASFHASRRDYADLGAAIASFRRQKLPNPSSGSRRQNSMPVAVTRQLDAEIRSSTDSSFGDVLLPPVKLWGTKRQRMEKEYLEMRSRLEVAENKLDRLINHIVFGKLLKVWTRFVNKELPAPD